MHFRLWLVTLFFTPAVVHAGDWPQWLGPNRDASSSEVVTPWKKPPRILWRKPVGEGNSSPVVAGGKVYLHDKTREGLQERLTAFDATTGKVLWQTVYPRPELKTLFGNGPRATPAVAGNRIYTFGITGLLTCFDTTSGKLLWQVDTAKELGAARLLFGASCSPMVEDQSVLVNIGGRGAAVAAFRADTGKVAWKTGDDGASYASPMAFGQGAGRIAVFLAQQGLLALHPGDGKPLWRFPFKDAILESSTTPVRVADVIFISSITQGMVALKLPEKDKKASPRQLWRNGALTCYFATPVAVGKDHLFAVIGSNPLAAINPLAKKKTSASLKCIDLHSGKELWTRDNVGRYHATLLRTGDGKLLMLEEAGDLVLLEPNPRAYRELARSKICGFTWAHPALADRRFYVRDGKELLCLTLP
jgi:outer membrane protein assembly factor BamB